MGTFTAKYLADGQLPSSAGDLYTSPSLTTSYVRFFNLFNDNAAEQTIVIWLQKSGGTARKIARYVISQNESVDVLEDGAIILEAGDKIRATTTTATAVDYYITGVQEA